jgi:hypothetical protein
MSSTTLVVLIISAGNLVSFGIGLFLGKVLWSRKKRF